jgi:hypothetical protein
MASMECMKDLAVVEQHIFGVFQNAHLDIMNEPVYSGSGSGSAEAAPAKDDDEESVWTDYDSAEEDEEGESDSGEDERTVILCNCHETLVEPCFDVPKPFDPCAICFEEIKMVNVTVTRCGHVFHASCMFEAIAAKSCCPLCRTQLVNNSGDDEDSDYEEDEIVEDEDDEGEDMEEVIVSWVIDRTPN